MIGSALRGLVAARASWWAPAMISALVAVVIGVCLVQAVGTDTSDPGIQEVLHRQELNAEYVSSVGVGIAVMIVPVAVIVLATVSAAAVGNMTRDLARWRLAGASGPSLAAFVMGQLTLVALAGGAVGAVVTSIFGGRLAELLNGAILPELAGVAVTPTPSALLGSLLGPPVTALAAGLLPAIRGARVPALRAVRRDEESEGRVGIRRLAAAVVGLVALGAVLLPIYRRPPGVEGGTALTAGLGLAVLVLVVAAVGSRILVPVVVLAIARLLPVRGTVWAIARDGAVSRARLSGATVVALACGTGILGAITGMARTSEAIARALGSREEFNLLDTYIICGAVGLLSAVGGACVLALGAGDRRREVALLRTAGMAPRQIVGAAAAEAVMLAGAATLIGLVATVTSTGLISRAAAAGGLPVRFVVPGAELAVAASVTIAVLVLALTVPARRALRSPVRSSLAAL